MTVDLSAQIHQYLTTAPGSLFTQQEVTILDHWQGDANLLWRVRSGGEDAVVKLFLDAGQARSRRQHDGHEVFAPFGLAPHPLWADRYPHGLSRQLIVYRWVEGALVDLNDPGELWAWAEALAALHTAPPENVRRFSPHPVNLDYYWRIEEETIAQIRRWLNQANLAIAAHFDQLATVGEKLALDSLPLWIGVLPTAIHGDLSHEHTLVARGRIVLLDWESFGLGDAAFELARLLQREAQTLTQEQSEALLNRYLEVIDLPGHAERIDAARRLLELHNVVYLLSGLQQHASGAEAETLVEALPFLQDTLAAAVERAAEALTIELSNVQPVVAEFMAWLSDEIQSA